MIDAYILVDKQPVREPDLRKWAQWYETANRRVALTEHELFTVSTAFVGLNHRFLGEGPPLVFETMAFHIDGLDNRAESFDCERYASWDDAVAGHKTMVKRMLARAALAEEQARVARFAEIDRELQRGWIENPLLPLRDCPSCGHKNTDTDSWRRCAQCGKLLPFPKREPQCSPKPRSRKPSTPSRSPSRSTSPSK